MSLSFPSSEHTSYSIRLLPSLTSSSSSSASSSEDPDPGETWSGPRFQADPEPEIAPPPPAAPAIASARPSYSSRSVGIAPVIPPPLPQRAKAPRREPLAPLALVAPLALLPVPRRAGRFHPTPARIAAVACGALMLVVVTAIVSYVGFSYLFRLL